MWGWHDGRQERNETQLPGARPVTFADRRWCCRINRSSGTWALLRTLRMFEHAIKELGLHEYFGLLAIVDSHPDLVTRWLPFF